jgi:hypothetical protein
MPRTKYWVPEVAIEGSRTRLDDRDGTLTWRATIPLDDGRTDIGHLASPDTPVLATAANVSSEEFPRSKDAAGPERESSARVFKINLPEQSQY